MLRKLNVEGRIMAGGGDGDNAAVGGGDLTGNVEAQTEGG